MPFYRAFLIHFQKQTLIFLKQLRRQKEKTPSALNAYLLQGKQCKREAKDMGCLQHLPGEALEQNHPVCGSACPLTVE